jgi:hypothetical protein
MKNLFCMAQASNMKTQKERLLSIFRFCLLAAGAAFCRFVLYALGAFSWMLTSAVGHAC